MAMAQEEHAQKCSNSSGDGFCCSRSSKKLKQKKVPQRGLGVAQLEKIRLEEQHRRENVLSPNSMASSINSLTCLQISQSPTILLPNMSRSHLSSPSSIPLPQQPSSCVPMFDQSLHSSPIVPFSKPLNVDGGERGRSALLIPDHTHWPKLWDGEYYLDGENQRLDQHGISLWPNINIPIESHSSLLPLPTPLQRSKQYQQPASSSMVNILSGISSYSARNFHIEPPSNQNFRDNDFTPLWPEEVKMVGVKRPYPFSPEYPPLPSFNCKFLPGYASPTSRANEPASCGNGSLVNVESHNPPLREGTSNTNSLFESDSSSLNREKGVVSGDFLSLAPPAASSPQIDHSYNHCTVNRGCEEMIKRPGMNEWGQPHIFSFFPPAKVQIDLEESSKRRYKSNSNGVVDLNLKL